MNTKKRRREIKGNLAVLILFVILITALVVPAYSEESYYLETTIRAPTPTGSGGFGASLEYRDGILLVGEYYVEGSELDSAGKAYVYDSNWNLTAVLLYPTPGAFKSFASVTVGIMGETLAVASAFCQVEELDGAGLMYLFNSEGDLLRTLQSPQPEDGAGFGQQFKLTDEYIVASEDNRNIQGLYDSGCVQVINYEGDHIATLTSPSITPAGAFGRALDANEEYIIIGEPGKLSGPLLHGSVYVFDHDFNLVKTLQSPDLQNYSNYGHVVIISQDRVLVSEKWATVDGHKWAGRVHVYNTQWELLYTLQSPTPEENGELGEDVDIEGNIIVVGERKGDVEVMNEGKAHVFDLEGNLLTTLISPEPEIGAQFGYTVITDGNIVIVDELDAAVEGTSKAGKVHIFRLGEPAAEEPEPEEESTEADSDTESEKSGGIPGFPVDSVVVGLVLAALMLWLIQRKR